MTGPIGPQGEAIAQPHQWLAEPIGQGRKQQGQAEDGQQHQGQKATGLVGLHHPAAADGGQAAHRGKGHRHAHEHRQNAAAEGLAQPGKHKRQHRQDAGAEDCQQAAKEGQDQHTHHSYLISK